MAGSVGAVVDAPVAPANPKGRFMSPSNKPGCHRPGSHVQFQLFNLRQQQARPVS